MEKYIKFTVNVPLTHCDQVRKAMGYAGAGRIGTYGYCSFSIKGTGRFVPSTNSKPWLRESGNFESVEEEQIESFCFKDDLQKILEAIKLSHPYEEPAISCWEVEIH